jgi:hypothetical protein
MTPAQLTALKADIAADPAFANVPRTGDGAYEIAQAYNLPASPEFVVWKTSVEPDEIMRNGMDWTRVDNLSVGKARIWDWITRLGTFDASRLNIRAAIDATWVGTSADLAVRAMVYTHCKRPASRVEKLFAAGLGTTAAPATMSFEGAINYQDVLSAWNA